MSAILFSIEIQNEQGLPRLRQITRRVAGLLGFPNRPQAEISAAAALVASAALERTGRLVAELLVENPAEAGVLLVAVRFDGKWPLEDAESGVEGSANRSVTGLVDLFHVDSGPGKETTVTVGKEFPPGTHALTGEALSGIAFGLDRGADTEPDGLQGPLEEIAVANELLCGKLEENGSEEADIGIRLLVEAIRENLSRSRDLIEDLLSLAEAGVVPVEICDVDVSRVVSEVLEEKAALIEERGAALVVDGDMGRLAVSPGHIYQLFANLLDCALADSDSACPAVEVRRLENGGGGAPSFLVRGNGPGLQAGRLDEGMVSPLLGERFAGAFRKLATAERIVKLYNGGLSVYDDGGTCFRFFLAGLDETGFDRL